MASATVVAGQLSLSSISGAVAPQTGATVRVATQCGVVAPGSRARMLMGASAGSLPQLRSAGFAQGSMRRRVAVFAKVSEAEVDASETAEEAQNAAQDFLKSVQDAWEKVDDKLAIGGLGFAALIALWASTGLIAALDKLPLVPGFLEFVGLVFSGWFVYRYLLFKPDREELFRIIDDAKGKITGQ